MINNVLNLFFTPKIWDCKSIKSFVFCNRNCVFFKRLTSFYEFSGRNYAVIRYNAVNKNTFFIKIKGCFTTSRR